MLIYGWQSVLIHSNVRLNFGPLRWLLASPEFHHWHHSNYREARNKNFAGQVPVLDYLFGTLHLPPGRANQIRAGSADPADLRGAVALSVPQGFRVAARAAFVTLTRQIPI